jgi:hypothetical protein
VPSPLPLPYCHPYFVDADARMLGVMEKSVSDLSALCGPAHTYVLAMRLILLDKAFESTSPLETFLIILVREVCTRSTFLEWLCCSARWYASISRCKRRSDYVMEFERFYWVCWSVLEPRLLPSQLPSGDRADGYVGGLNRQTQKLLRT